MISDLVHKGLDLLTVDANTAHLGNMPLSMKRTTSSTLPLDPDPPRLLARLPVVLRVTGLGRLTIYRLIASGSFPPPVHPGSRAAGWRWSDLDQWKSVASQWSALQNSFSRRAAPENP